MCIFILILMAIVLYALLGKLDGWTLIETYDETEWLRVTDASLLWELWPVWSLAFLSGVLLVLLILKLVAKKSTADI